MKKVKPIHIGYIIKQELERQGQTVEWLAMNIPTSTPNCYKILNSASINTDVLMRISVALEHNFFADIAKFFEDYGAGLEIDAHIFAWRFNSLIEPILKANGYTGKINTNGNIVLDIDGLELEIYHHALTCIYSVSVCLQFSFNQERLNGIDVWGKIALVNELMALRSAIQVRYRADEDKVIIEYPCYIDTPDDLIGHMEYALYLYKELLKKMADAIPFYIEHYPKEANINKT